MNFDVDFQVVRQLQRTKIRQLRMGDEDVDFVNKEAWSEAIGHIQNKSLDCSDCMCFECVDSARRWLCDKRKMILILFNHYCLINN